VRPQQSCVIYELEASRECSRRRRKFNFFA
jgi:hypothetical protein